MRRVAWVAGVVAAVALSVLAHALAGVFFLFGVCGVSDTAVAFPAPASPQGLVCDAHPNDTRWELLAFGALAVSTVLAVVLFAVLFGRAGRARLLSPVPLVVLPLLTLALLALPPDTCSDEARRTHPAYDCRTTPD